MPKVEIQLTKTQSGYFRAARLCSQQANEKADLLRGQANSIMSEVTALLGQATALERDMLAHIGEEHGVEIPEAAEMKIVDGVTFFSWPTGAPSDPDPEEEGKPAPPPSVEKAPVPENPKPDPRPRVEKAPVPEKPKPGQILRKRPPRVRKDKGRDSP